MKMRKLDLLCTTAALAISVVVGSGCDSTNDRPPGPGPRPDGGPTDATTDARVADASAIDGGWTDTGPGTDASGADAAATDAGAGPFGFAVRVPQNRTITCMGPGGMSYEADFPDIDTICAIDHGNLVAHLYVQSRATDCGLGLTGMTYSTDGAWISDAMGVRAATATYDLGGNHRNDFILLDHGGQHYKLYHSSFGFGWRACAPPDCLEVYQADRTTLVTNGCDVARSIPIVCKRVNNDGTVPDMVDDFMWCPGDPNH